MKIVLSPNPYLDKELTAVRTAQRVLREAGCETALTLPFGGDDRLTLPGDMKLLSAQEAFRNADLLICFGGDGTILHAAKDALAHGNIPVLGVNLGSMGFMAELEPGELSLLARLPRGDYREEKRMLLDVAVRREGKIIHRDTALNDAVLTKGAVARVIDLEVLADGILMSSFPGDGVVIGTPTGSTAYSMSAGGPIVEPTAENITVTPICPHALYARSLVLDGSRMVTVLPDEHSKKAVYLSVDGGKAFHLKQGDRVELRRSRNKVRLIRLTDRSFYSVIHDKLTGRTQG